MAVQAFPTRLPHVIQAAFEIVILVDRLVPFHQIVLGKQVLVHLRAISPVLLAAYMNEIDPESAGRRQLGSRSPTENWVLPALFAGGHRLGSSDHAGRTYSEANVNGPPHIPAFLAGSLRP
jgi:hypothetical protein